VKGEIKNERSRDVQGERAGFVTQALGGVADWLVIMAVYFASLVVYGFLRFLLTSQPFAIPQPDGWVNGDLVFVIGVLLLWSAWSGSGRAPGMAVFGLRVVADDGACLSSKRAFWRAVLAVATLGVGLVFVLFSKRNRSLYDMICKSSVIYAWRPSLPYSRLDR
jgi:uncharacterized RDD family membrane protein YckC